MPLTIRTMHAGDKAAVNALSAQLGYPQPETATAAHIEAVQHSSGDCAYVALEGSEIVGWIHGFITRRIETGAFAEIGGLVVDDRHRGKGIGKALVDRVKDWSRAKGVNILRLRSNVIRTEAHNFYTRLGFTIAKEQKVFEQQL